MSEQLDEKAYQMPHPEFMELSPNSRIAFTSDEKIPITLTISWQWVLAKIGEALIARDPGEVIQLLFSETDYVQLNQNAIEDVCSIVRQPVDTDVLIKTQAKINSLQKLMSKYLSPMQPNQPQLDYIIYESDLLVDKLKSFDVISLGAFMVASGLQLALLEETAKSDSTAWSQVKDRAIDASQWAASTTPKLFRLSIGQIDKTCQCTKWEPGPEGEVKTVEFECRYSDGKDVHIFRQLSPLAGFECNKHRLQRFHSVANEITQTVAYPVREAIKDWQELAASI